MEYIWSQKLTGHEAPPRHLVPPSYKSSNRNGWQPVESLTEGSYRKPWPSQASAKTIGCSTQSDVQDWFLMVTLLSSQWERLSRGLTRLFTLLTRVHNTGRYPVCYWRAKVILNICHLQTLQPTMTPTWKPKSICKSNSRWCTPRLRLHRPRHAHSAHTYM